MDHFEAIERIVNAEKQARQLVSDAKGKEAGLEDDVALEIEKLRSKYKDLAKGRVLEIEAEEKRLAQDELDGLEEDYRRKLETMDRAFSSLFEEWKDKCFRLVAGE